MTTWCTKILCSPLCGICFCAFHGPFVHLRKTGHSMTCTALCWGEWWGRGISGWSRWRGVFCGLLHTGAVLLCRWLNRFAYLSCVVLCSHCIIVQRVKAFIVTDGLLRHFGLLWAASWNLSRQHQLLDKTIWEATWQINTYLDIIALRHVIAPLLLCSLRWWVYCVLNVGIVWASECLFLLIVVLTLLPINSVRLDTSVYMTTSSM